MSFEYFRLLQQLLMLLQLLLLLLLKVLLLLQLLLLVLFSLPEQLDRTDVFLGHPNVGLNLSGQSRS